MMKLKRFRVTQFRSVDDSGWVETDDVTALIGTNESGKTNILLPLWKLNPAKEGAIVPTAAYPRKRYNEIRHQALKPIFIRAIFEIDDDLASQLSRWMGGIAGYEHPSLPDRNERPHLSRTVAQGKQPSSDA